MKLCRLRTVDVFQVSGDIDVQSSERDNSTLGLPGVEPYLKVKHAELFTNFEKEVGDDPEFACCSCERLFQRKNITSMKNWEFKFTSQAWEELKEYILRQNENVSMESLFVCSYCRPILNANDMPRRCILNGLETEPIPAELSRLDALSKQLIQRAKSFQTVVRLGTYTGKVPAYSSLKASKGTMFFLPLPMEKTLETLEEVNGDDQCPLPSPELYIMVNGKPSKEKVVWRTIVNVDAAKAAINTLKQIRLAVQESGRAECR